MDRWETARSCQDASETRTMAIADRGGILIEFVCRQLEFLRAFRRDVNYVTKTSGTRSIRGLAMASG